MEEGIQLFREGTHCEDDRFNKFFICYSKQSVTNLKPLGRNFAVFNASGMVVSFIVDKFWLMNFLKKNNLYLI